jgi:hypothetical protein
MWTSSTTIFFRNLFAKDFKLSLHTRLKSSQLDEIENRLPFVKCQLIQNKLLDFTKKYYDKEPNNL